MTQAQFDGLVIAVSSYQSKMSEQTVALKKQGDPAAYHMEEKLIMLQNIINALAYYDLDSEILSDVDIKYYFELATNVVESCPF